MVFETLTKRNPPWQRDETILALDLYFRHHPKFLKPSDPVVVELSRILNKLPIHMERSDTFRNASGVIKKLWNFAQYDPNYMGVGLKSGAKMDKIIWDEFAENLPHLHNVAMAIKKGLDTDPTIFVGVDDEDASFPEGKILYRLHKLRERNGKLTELAKKRAKDAGRLRCEVCKFDFAQKYGDLGEGYIECHHVIPISDYKDQSKTRVEDLAMVCSNCHRMLHRKRPWLSISDLKSILDSNREERLDPTDTE